MILSKKIFIRGDGVKRLIRGIKMTCITMAFVSVVIFGFLAILLIGAFIANATPFGSIGTHVVFLMYIITIISVISGVVNSKE